MIDRLSTTVLLAVAILAGLAVGGLVGALTHAPKQVAPAAVARPAEGFPNGSSRYFAGVTVPALQLSYQRAGYQCSPSTTPPSGVKQETECLEDSGAYTFIVDFDGVDAGHVGGARATCFQPPAGSVAPCGVVFAALVQQVIAAGQPSLAGQAAAWASQNTGSDSSTTMGRFHLATVLSPILTVEVSPSS
jgi:hypothetical protein